MPVLQRPPPSRRMTSRVGARDVWAYWSCNGRDDVTPVLDLSLGECLSRRQATGLWEHRARLIFLFKKDKSGLRLLCATWSPIRDWV